MTKILLVQGANLTFLGRREPDIYGTTTPAEIQRHAQKHGYHLTFSTRTSRARRSTTSIRRWTKAQTGLS